ncbi:class I SAM-dependent DNA methyltransferase [Christiangramia sabulilitoris]|uniref:Class I SAM-dependent methyltransferase n=1 Tax=Christiangramia sabulilitoris TaxID=2583991 RepID=A0A550I8C5_9FLAO|nr:class I SAM-dependent methyltransferase [Christiangramia sabulilitoris]TRO67214.1 class I SAM-dependent methyltransferase [Christiangramia sabulilitoris]
MSVEKAYDSWSSSYDLNENKTRDLDKSITKNVLGDLRFDSVLELGCGTGKNTEWFQTRAGRVLGIDFSREMLQLARQKFPGDKICFTRADLNHPWNWTSEKFDLLTFSLVLEHFKDLSFIFQESLAKMKAGGYLFISELHPFKQYLGSKARFETKNGSVELETYTHHISEYIDSASKQGLNLIRLDEWFDEDGKRPPRILSILFQLPQ